MSFVNQIFLATVVFSALINGGSSIYCFYCNSANNSACLDMNRYDSETLSRIIPMVNCKVDNSDLNPPAFFCRKLVQTIYRSGHESEYRVTRGCGWIRHEQNDCYSTHNPDHLETACQCFTDGCNSADSADPTSSVFLFLVFAAVLYFYR